MNRPLRALAACILASGLAAFAQGGSTEEDAFRDGSGTRTDTGGVSPARDRAGLGEADSARAGEKAREDSILAAGQGSQGRGPDEIRNPKYFHPFSGLYAERPTIVFFPQMVDPVVEDSILFEGEPAIHLPFLDNLAARAEAGETWAQAIFFSFIPHLRMSMDTSMPVRMPSYRPRLGFQLHRIGRSGSDPRLRHLITGTYLIGHYSNGQFGCTFSESLADESAACVERVDSVVHGGLDPSLSLNRRSGEFSTNVTGFKLGYKRIRLGTNHRPRTTWTWYLFPYCNLQGGPGGLAEAYEDIYGTWRLEGGMEYENAAWSKDGLTGLTRFSLKAAWLETDHPDVAWYMVEAEAAHTFDRMNGFGFYLRMRKGQDAYNVFYVDDVLHFHLGIIWDASGRITFQKQP